MADAEAFALRWQSDFPLSLFADAPPDEIASTPPDIVVEQASWPPPEHEFQTKLKSCWIGNNLLRLFALDGSVMDVIGTNLIRVYLPPDAPQTVPPTIPPEFYSRVAALICAQRGLLPIHGSTVAIGGKAFLLFGESGNGKSSAAAALIGMGAKLLADDLSVISVDDDGAPCVAPGRLGIRLNSGAEVLLEQHKGTREPISESREKSRFFPPRMEGLAPTKLAGMAYMDTTGDFENILPQFTKPLLNQHIFVRHMLRKIDGDTKRYAMIRRIVDYTSCQRIRGLADRNLELFQQRLARSFSENF